MTVGEDDVGSGLGEATRDPEAILSDSKAKQQAINEAVPFTEYLANRNAAQSAPNDDALQPTSADAASEATRDSSPPVYSNYDKFFVRQPVTPAAPMSGRAVAPGEASGSNAGTDKSAPEIFMAGLSNLADDPLGWMKGEPSATLDGRVVPSGSSGESREGAEESGRAQMLRKIKDAGIAGIVSYGIVQLAFFGASIPVCLLAYNQVTGHWPDLSNPEDQAQLATEAFAFLNLARLAIPLRIAVALAMSQKVQTGLLDRFQRGSGSSTDRD